MHIIMRTTAAAALAITGALSIGLATPATANAATRVAINISIGSHEDREARVALPAPTRLNGPEDGDAPLTVNVTQRSICTGTTKCVAFSGTGVPGQTVVVTYEVNKNPLFSNRGAAGISLVSEKVNVDGTGNWSLTTHFPHAVVTTDAAGKRSVVYHVVESKNIVTLVSTARFVGAIPIR